MRQSEVQLNIGGDLKRKQRPFSEMLEMLMTLGMTHWETMLIIVRAVAVRVETVTQGWSKMISAYFWFWYM